MMKTARVDPDRSEGGFMMMMTALFVLPLLLIGSAAIAMLGGRSATTTGGLAQERALQAAEAAIDMSIYMANTNSLHDDDSINGVLGSGLSWHMIADDMLTDFENNDGDADVDEPDEVGFEVTATGSYGNVTRRVVAYVRPIAPLPPIVAAVALQDPASVLDIHGGSFTITGDDKNIDGSPGSAPPVYGACINNPGTVGSMFSLLSAAQRARITGVGGGSSGTTGTFAYDDLFAAIRPVAHNLLPGGHYMSIANFGDAASDTWRVTYVDGNLELAGNQVGAGVLVVDGNLWFSGNCSFIGIVLVKGNVRFTGGGSSKLIRGSLMVGGDAAMGDVIELSGTVDIQYSTQTIQRVRGMIERRVLAGWREVARS